MKWGRSTSNYRVHWIWKLVEKLVFIIMKI